MFVSCKRKVFKLLTQTSRCQPISKASSIQQSAGGCCRSTLRAPGRRKLKNAALWVFKQRGPPETFTHDRAIGLSEKYLVWKDQTPLQLELQVISSLIIRAKAQKRGTHTHTVERGHRRIYSNFLIEHFGRNWKLISTFFSEIISRQHSNRRTWWQHDAASPYSIHPHAGISCHCSPVLKWQRLKNTTGFKLLPASVKTCVSRFNRPFSLFFFSVFLFIVNRGVCWGPAGHTHQ